jgi:hypothetical protein
MALPTSREQFRTYILRNLGAPVIKINVDDDQIEDRIDEAFLFWYDYSFEGTEKMYYKYALTEEDFTNKFITLPDNIIGAVRIFDLSGVNAAIANPFNIQYQIMMNDLYSMSSFSMVPYYVTFQHLQFMQQLLIGQQPIRYNRNTNKLFIDMDWAKVRAGQYIIVEAYSVLDPVEYPDVWKDRQLLKLATAYLKRQWGSNSKKYRNIELLGGNVMTGQEMYDEAMEEIENIEQSIVDSSLPASDMIG